MQRKKHSREEIATKLSKADELHERGKTQAETYHRWRKTRSQPGLNGTTVPDLPQSAVEELHKEIGRLRQLLTDRGVLDCWSAVQVATPGDVD